MSNYTYMVTNKINGKVYVGSHSWKGEGIDPSYYGSGTAITRAVKKYGKENFQVEVLYYYDTVEECRADEERILTEYNVRDCPHSYNIKNAAVGFTSEDIKGEKHPLYGKHLSDETKKKLSQAKKGKNKGKTLSEETRKKIAQAHKGKPLSEETRKKMSQAHKGKTKSEETRKKMSQAQKGKTLSEEQKRKLLQANKGRTLSDEHRQKIAQSMKGKTASEETRQKLSQANDYRKTPIVAIQKDTGKVKIFESQSECARKLNLSQSHILSCLKGRRKTHKGYTFKYIEQLESGIYEGFKEGIAE